MTTYRSTDSALSAANAELGLPMKGYGAPSWSANGNGMGFGRTFMENFQEPALTRMPRRQLNITSIIMCLFLPVGFFMSIFWFMSFRWHYSKTVLCYVCVFAIAPALLVVIGTAARGAVLKRRVDSTRELTWLNFLFASMLLAWILALLLGSLNYSRNLKPYYEIHELNVYTNVQPNITRGLQAMDAGRIVFAPGTIVDIQMAMSFRDVDMYCVAPITIGNKTLATYDFWAVGVNCCSAGGALDFHCAGYSDAVRGMTGGLRLMNDNSRAFFRLAVQQAESMHGIKAVHPLFFEVVPDPLNAVNGMLSNGVRNYQYGSLAHFALQSFLVAAAAMAFSRLGFL